ncbi:DUF4258 domain-containing protein [Limnospira fusiformis SAG 85.79]|nr:DUF4258 domain-containing protein [Limnospira fusiformis SAG 85.79]
MEVLETHGITISPEIIQDTIRAPDKVESREGEKYIAQKRLNETLVLRVVYREYADRILVITHYPGRRSRYETDSI